MTPAAAFSLTIAFALAGGLAALAFDAFGRRRTAVAAAALGLAGSGVVGMWAGWAVPTTTVFSVARVGGPFSAVPGIIALLAAVAVLGGFSEFAERPAGGSAAGLVALAAAASGLMAASADITLLLVALETAAVCAYALVADARSPRADEASMKYFIQGSVATGAYVMGLAVLVGVFAPSGTYSAMASAFVSPSFATTAVAGAVLVLAALAFKLGAAPFHSWAPDSYQTARPEVSAFLSAGPKLGAIAAFAVFLELATIGSLRGQLVAVTAVIAVVSLLVGSLVALRQRSYTRMLGYAGVAQAGYALIGAAVLQPSIAVFFGATYAIATTGAFLAAAAFRRARPSWDGSIAGLAGLGKRTPLLSGSLAVLLVSLAGVPPLLGFWGKFQVFVGATLSAADSFKSLHDPRLGWTYAILAGVGIIASVVSLGYYGGVLRALFFDAENPADGIEAGESSPSSAAWVVAGLALVVIALGIAPLFWGVSSVVAPFVVR